MDIQTLLIVNAVGIIIVLVHSVRTRTATKHIIRANTALQIALSLLNQQQNENTVMIGGLVHNIELLHERLLAVEPKEET